jgi:membrane-bound lytic murein transglycosylase D
MLNRKFVAAAFFGNGLFLTMAFNGSHAGSIENPRPRELDTAIISLQAFDSSITNLQLGESDIAALPRITMNRRATKFVNDYTKKNSTSLNRLRSISEPYFTIIDSILKNYRLPHELRYLAVIESQLQAKARSHAGAVGPWQLMPATARIYSLKVKGRIDERTHYYKSTRAAAEYLANLHDEFEDWLLVIAAYNAGPGKVRAAIRKSGSKSFWSLQSYLPLETQLHVKKFIATHYFFEGHGSIATLTGAEVKAFRKQLTAYIEKKKAESQKALTVASIHPKEQIGSVE